MPPISIPEDKQEEWQKLQEQHAQQRKLFQNTAAQMAVIDREKARNGLTNAELDKLPAETVMYKQVGKMFVQAPGDKVKAEIAAETKSLDTRMSELGTKRAAYEAAVKDTEGQLQAIVDKAIAAGGSE
mmetsp:Transcript_17495/g.40359  ORF Transcript_17495/g.40359 Transcript_17495/m.40359 type:complete len:128 (+) Transcript_17495:110-493(+)|eukprot:CAMPEP_0114127168 /NCGR_PEP_ID=MMETSP0043_2-20121206/10225_1 /TAXON_ID=464988 /ORGANISM="Hemiselmis andersenii, Strain CCMP644" /LENGTH=127 /DNA_ID=CAMNT_0001220213 /DNA_START=158 /DNA_END=541 /DNA_ORIENTATION=+